MLEHSSYGPEEIAPQHSIAVFRDGSHLRRGMADALLETDISGAPLGRISVDYLVAEVSCRPGPPEFPPLANSGYQTVG